MKRVSIILVLAISVLSGCSELKESIKELQDRVDLLENVTIANIDQQIDAIRNSIASLNATDSELADYTDVIKASVDDLSLQLDAFDADLNALKNEFGNDMSDAEKRILEQLEDVRKALEENIANLMKTIETLSSRNEDLSKKIEELEEYLESRLEGSSNWSESTFATLEQYAAIQSEIAAIKAIAEQTDKELADLEKELKSKIDNDIKDTVEMLRAEMASDISALEILINSVAEACRTSVAEASRSISASYMNAIAVSIAECERSMKTWVNARLAEGYYDIAAVDAEIAALENLVTESDDDLEELIEEQEQALAAAKAEMDKAYKSVIDEIVANNGRINETIDTKVNAAMNILQGQIDDIDMAIEELRERIEELEDRVDKLEGDKIKTIEEQIAAINVSIEDLKGVDAELKGYIESLQGTAADLQSKIDATNTALAALESDLEGQITASEQKVLSELNTVKTALEGQLATINNTIATLQAKDAELDQKIADLQTYVDSEITATEDWATATFSTLEQYEATQTAISDINALIKSTQESITALEKKLDKKITDDIAAAVAGVNADIAAKVTEITDAYTAAIATAKEDITAAYADAIKTAITASETSMKAWVNGVLAEGYYTKAEIDGKITALQTQVTNGDAALQKEIDDLETALAQAESDLTAAYEKAIKDAINENNGKISADIAAAVKAAQDNLQAQIDAINSEIQGIEDRLTSIESAVDKLVGRIQSIRFMPEYSDGCVAFGYKTHSVVLDFKISPASVASELQTSWQSDPSIIGGYILYTITRSSNEPIALEVTEVTGNEDGILTVKLKESSENPLSDAFWNGEQNASVYITINDGNNDIQSELIPTTCTEFEIVEENNEVAYYVNALPGLLKWAYDVNVLGKKDANFVLEADVELPQYEIRQDDLAQTYSYTDTPITVNANGIPSGSNWVPIRNVISALSDGYSGHFSGVDENCRTIKGLRIVSTGSYTSFIGLLYDDASIKNIKFMDAIISGKQYTGIVGRSTHDTLVENIHVLSSTISGTSEVGGIVGYNYTRNVKSDGTIVGENISSIINSTIDSESSVKGSGSTVGGICGNNTGAIIINCINQADITGTSNVGGIVGYSREYNTGREAYVIACVSTDDASITATNTSNGYAGGIVGHTLADYNHHNLEYVVACSSASTISANNPGLIIGTAEHNGSLVASWAQSNSQTAKLVRSGSITETASYKFETESDISQEIIAEMNQAIDSYNQTSGIEQTCPYKWTWTEGNWPTLSVINQ